MASSYLQINEYILLEYEYASQAIPLAGAGSAKSLRIENLYQDQYQFINNSQAVETTGNVLDRTSSLMNKSSNYWAYHDIDAVFPTISSDTNFILTDITPSLIGSIKYDVVKLHILSGYNFEGVEGFISEIIFKEFDGRNFSASSFSFLKGQTFINFSVTPLFLGDRLYDRYIEYKVPSLWEINADFWPNPLSLNTFGYQYTHSNTGFIQDSPIYINFSEIATITTINGNRFLNTGKTYEASFPQSDSYSFLGSTVQENPDYDYIEFYPTYNGGFLEDYISALNSIGGSWVVINQIEVLEQVGTQLYRTANMTMMQDSGFDTPGIFRPVILNSGLAFSYTIEYTMRLFNRNDGQEIIRRSTFTSYNPKKYGKQLERINVINGFRPFKVYNKIETLSDSGVGANSYSNNVIPQPVISRVYINNFYESSMISVDSTSDISETVGATVYPQGRNYIFMNPFDNFFKFKIFTKSPDKKENVSLDLSTDYNRLNLVFIQDDETKIFIPATVSNTIAPTSGEALFKVDEVTAGALLKQSNKEYHIVIKTPEGNDTLIYSGNYARQKDREKIMKNLSLTIQEDIANQLADLERAKNDLANQDAELQAKAKAISDQQAILDAQQNNLNAIASATTGASSTTEALNASLKKELATIANAHQFFTKQQQSLKDALNKAATNKGNQFNLVEIPGVSVSMGQNVKYATQPIVQNPANPNANPEFTKPATGKGGQQISTVGT